MQYILKVEPYKVARPKSSWVVPSLLSSPPPAELDLSLLPSWFVVRRQG